MCVQQSLNYSARSTLQLCALKVWMLCVWNVNSGHVLDMWCQVSLCAGLLLWFFWCQWWMRSSHLCCAALFSTASSVSFSRMKLDSLSLCRPYCHLAQKVWSILVKVIAGKLLVSDVCALQQKLRTDWGVCSCKLSLLVGESNTKNSQKMALSNTSVVTMLKDKARLTIGR